MAHRGGKEEDGPIPKLWMRQRQESLVWIRGVRDPKVKGVGVSLTMTVKEEGVVHVDFDVCT
jgi:hypothetical protein